VSVTEGEKRKKTQDKSPVKEKVKKPKEEKNAEGKCSGLTSVKDSKGSEFSRQWPKIQTIFQSPNLETYGSENPTVLVSEKYDGSNLAVSSKGVVASRRTILLVQPTQQDLANFTFQNVSLGKLDGTFDKLSKLKKGFVSLLPDVQLAIDEVLVYGELILRGTANGNDDRYGYRDKGFNEGDLVIFGVGLTFDDNVDEIHLRKIKPHLQSQGFHVISKTNSTFHIAMSPELKRLLVAHHIGPIVEQKEMVFSEIAPTYKKPLLDKKMEGVVVSFGLELVKWKGPLSCQQAFLSEVEESQVKVDRETYEAFKAVVEESILSSSKNSFKFNARLENLFEEAYNSAKTKMRDLKEHLEDGGSTEEYANELEIEMLIDDHGNPNFRKHLHSFVSSKIIKNEKIIWTELAK